MAKGSIYRDRTHAWYAVAALVFLLFGCGFLWMGESDWLKTYPPIRSVISNIGGLTIASLGLGVVWELFGRRALVSEVFEATSVSRQVQDAKLFGVTTQFLEGVQWRELLEGAKELELMVWAGRTWRNTLDHSLSKLAGMAGSKITLILPDPENERVINELAERFSTQSVDVVKSIHEAEQYFRSLAEKSSMKKGSFTVWYTREAPLFTFYRIDDSYVLATYRHGGKGGVPTFVAYKGGCLAEFIENQKASLINKKNGLAHQVYPPPTKADTIQLDTGNATANDGTSDPYSAD